MEERGESYIGVANRQIPVLGGATRALLGGRCAVTLETIVGSYPDCVAITGGTCEDHILQKRQILDAKGEVQGGSGQLVVSTTHARIEYGKAAKGLLGQD